MDMSNFWNQTVATGHSIPVVDFSKRHKRELTSFRDEYDLNGAEFAEGPLPAFGPGGSTSDEDDDFFPSEEDAESPSQTVSEATGLMAYLSEVDELYVWNEEEEAWMLWNY